jgi:mannosyl-oligosaccharide alpha-1,2-mannosidase
MPYRFINLKTGAVRQHATSPADIATYLPEWGTLSRLTGDDRYAKAAKRAAVAVFDRRSKLDLVAVQIDVRDGKWLDRRATVGSYADSFFEYLWDSWQLFGDRDCKRMYDICTAAILRHQRVRKDGHLWFADVDFETGAVVSAEQDELASFYGGLLAQGGARGDGAAYAESWAAVQDRCGVLPEGYDYASAKPTQVTNALRPELADAAFNLWLLDKNPRWREIGATHFLNMKRWNKAEYGYTDLADVTSDPKKQADHCPGYWWSEQMKYYYLLFADTPRFDYRRNYLSTEGNVLLGFRRAGSAPTKDRSVSELPLGYQCIDAAAIRAYPHASLWEGLHGSRWGSQLGLGKRSRLGRAARFAGGGAGRHPRRLGPRQDPAKADADPVGHRGELLRAVDRRDAGDEQAAHLHRHKHRA